MRILADIFSALFLGTAPLFGPTTLLSVHCYIRWATADPLFSFLPLSVLLFVLLSVLLFVLLGFLLGLLGSTAGQGRAGDDGGVNSERGGRRGAG